MYHIKKISSQETFAVRQPVLRPGKPVTSCIFEGDDLDTTIHFGIFDQNNLVGIVSVFQSNNILFPETKQFQLRGMAILFSYQKKGLGEQLILHAEEYIKEIGGKRIWFNARENAVGFYEKMKYEITGPAFIIPGVGTHFVMQKTL